MDRPIEYHVQREVASDIELPASARRQAAVDLGREMFADCVKEEVTTNHHKRTHTYAWSVTVLPKNLSPKKIEFSFQENPEAAVRRKVMDAVEEARHALDTKGIAGEEYVQTRLVMDMVESILNLQDNEKQDFFKSDKDMKDMMAQAAEARRG